MATAPLPPIAGASYLEQLPAELIENIPLEVVKDVEPPVKWDMEGHTILRCQVQYGGKTNSSNASTLLAHRLASHTLRNSAWRALAKVIGETIFDIRSKESVENLVAISHCEVLAPWIHKLTVGYFTVDDIYPFSLNPSIDSAKTLANMDDRSRAELLRVRATDEGWYSSTWEYIDAFEEQALQTICINQSGNTYQL
jgi:hypothetical protein